MAAETRRFIQSPIRVAPHHRFFIAAAVVIGCSGCGQEGVAVPQTAQIVCNEDGSTTLVTPVVRTQRDGVHFRVRNDADEHALISSLGEALPGSSNDFVSTVEPGKVDVTCFFHSLHQNRDEPARHPLIVRDTDSYWVGAECLWNSDKPRQSSIHDFGGGADGVLRGDADNPIEAVREVEQLLPTDVVEVVGYAESSRPMVRLIRDEKIEKVFNVFTPDGGGWLVSGDIECEA